MAIITSAELKVHLGIPDTVDDPNVSTAAAAANAYVENYCGRDFDKTATASASARVFRPDAGCTCWTDDFWETSALVVKVDRGDDGTYEETWTLNTDFYLEPLNGLVNGQARPYYQIVALSSAGRAFPASGQRPSVQVTAAWGWTAVPDAVKHATLLQGARLFKRKDSAEGVVGGFADFTAVRVSARVDPDLGPELAPYRHPRSAGAPLVA